MPTHYLDLNDHLARRGLAAPHSGQQFYYDSKTAGLALRITAANSRAWIVAHWDPSKARTLRYTLADASAMTVKDARKAVEARKGNLAVGRADPFARHKPMRERITLRRVLEDYLSGRQLKERTVADYRYRVEQEAFEDWLQTPLELITRDDVERRHRKLAQTSGSRANGAMRVLRALFNFAIAKYEQDGKAIFTDNPVRRLSASRSWVKERRKHSAVPLRLMPAWFAAARDVDAIASDYLQCIALNGLRRGEAARLRWQDVDLKAGVYTIVDTKNSEPLRLPITHQLRGIFERRRRLTKSASVPSMFVFPARGQDAPIAEPRKTLDAICRLIDYPATVHDMRRSFINAADASGLPFMVIKLLVNHTLPTASGDVTMGYTAPDSDRMREAAQRVADILDGSAERATVAKLGA